MKICLANSPQWNEVYEFKLNIVTTKPTYNFVIGESSVRATDEYGCTKRARDGKIKISIIVVRKVLKTLVKCVLIMNAINRKKTAVF